MCTVGLLLYLICTERTLSDKLSLATSFYKRAIFSDDTVSSLQQSQQAASDKTRGMHLPPHLTTYRLNDTYTVSVVEHSSGGQLEDKDKRKSTNLSPMTTENASLMQSKSKDTSSDVTPTPHTASKNVENSENLGTHNSSSITSYAKPVCAPNMNIYFIKTRKTGSTSICNILSRFGLKNNLTFPLRGIESKPHSINMVAQHHEYSESYQDKVMRNGAIFMTILREPFTNFISAVVYYKVDTKFDEFPGNNPMEQIEMYLKEYCKNQKSGQYIQNRMAKDLGFTESVMSSEKMTLEYIKHLEQRLDIVLIMDYFSESLVLLRRSQCWGIEDILYRKAMPEYNQNKKEFPVDMAWFNTSHKAMCREFSPIDHMVYDHFLKIFWNRIDKEGPDFYKEVAYLKSLTQTLETFCKDTGSSQQFTFQASPWNEEFTVTKDNCAFMTWSDVQLQGYIANRVKDTTAQ